MALNRVWVRGAQQNQYINLWQDVDFRRNMMRKDGPIVKWNLVERTDRYIEPFLKQFVENAVYHGLSDKVNIETIVGFGRGIVATQPIRVHEIVAKSESYITTFNQTPLVYCVACGGGMNKRNRCKNRCQCYLCSKCNKSTITPHYYECHTTFHGLYFNNLYMKCAVELLFKTLAEYKVKTPQHLADLKQAMTTIAGTINNVPARATSRREKSDCVLRLSRVDFEGLPEEWFEVYALVTDYPRIKEIFATAEDQQFLQHLLAHCLAIAYTNSFENIMLGTQISHLHYTPSYFNHSCSPNVLDFQLGKELVCVATRPIAAGEQLFIDYVNFRKACSTEKRREYLRNSWGIENCGCVRCTNGNEITRGQIKVAVDDLRNDYDAFKTSLEVGGAWTRELGAKIIAYQKMLAKPR